MDGNSAYNPIEIEKNFIIKVEDVDVPIKLENGDDLEHPIILNEQAVLRHPRCIPAKRDPGKPRGFAAMVSCLFRCSQDDLADELDCRLKRIGRSMIFASTPTH